MSRSNDIKPQCEFKFLRREKAKAELISRPLSKSTKRERERELREGEKGLREGRT